MTSFLVIALIFCTFSLTKSENVLCSTCVTNLQKCLKDHNDPASFITGKNTNLCDCCNDYTNCIGDIKCDMVPSACISIDCSNKAYIGWIVISIVIIVILVLIVVLYFFNRHKTVHSDNFVDNANRENVLNLKFKDIQMYQRLAEVVLSSSSSSESDDESETPKSIQIGK
ncbi:Uncharacterized protein QTN25_002505 [Entamoeba marina]